MTIQVVRLVVQEAEALPRHHFRASGEIQISDNDTSGGAGC